MVMSMDKECIHDKIRDEVKRWLESKNCVVHSRVQIELPLSSLNRNDWNYLLNHGKLQNLRLPSASKWIYKRSLRKPILVRQRKYIVVDLLGYKEEKTNNFIIEISHSSSLAKKVEKLKGINKIETKVIVVTDNTERQVNGVRIIPYGKFKDWFEKFFILR
jgi:hypothetical protein